MTRPRPGAPRRLPGCPRPVSARASCPAVLPRGASLTRESSDSIISIQYPRGVGRGAAVIAPPLPVASWGCRPCGRRHSRGLPPSSGGGPSRCMRVGSALCVFPPLCACGSWVTALVASEGNFLGCPWRRVSARSEYLSLAVFCTWPPVPAACIQHSRNLT